MIDTLKIEIKDLVKYKVAVEAISYIKGGRETHSIEVDKDQAKRISEMPNVIKQIHYMDSGRVFLFSDKKIRNKSSDYGVNCMVNSVKDCISIELSVPKWVFGSNVMQFIPHSINRDYRYYEAARLGYGGKGLYKRLSKFITAFCAEELKVKVDLRDVELRRFDLCYNMVFGSKEEAFQYLEMIRQVKAKFARNGVTPNNYSSGIVINSKRHYFKIYHKGTEFNKNDRAKLNKVNEIRKKRGLVGYDVAGFGALADKTLRFEMEFRPIMINYVYKYKLFRSGCKLWKERKRKWMKVSSIRGNIREWSELSDKQRQKWRGRVDYQDKNISWGRLSKEDKSKWEVIEKFMNKTHGITWFNDSEKPEIHKRVNVGGSSWDLLHHVASLGMSERVMSECVKVFVERCKYYKVIEAPGLDVFRQRLVKENKKIARDRRIKVLDRNKSAVNSNEMRESRLMLIYNLVIGKTYAEVERELVAGGVINKHTWKRWKGELKKLGYDGRVIKGVNNVAKDMSNEGYYRYVNNSLRSLLIDQKLFRFLDKE